MLCGRIAFVDVVQWCLLVFLALHVPRIEMRLNELEHTVSDTRPGLEQMPSSTVKPEPVKQEKNKCFHMPRESCPPEGEGCARIDPVSVFCCDVTGTKLKDALSLTMTQNTTKLHVLSAHIDELDISQAVFRRLASMAVTDGQIGKIIVSSEEDNFNTTDYNLFEEYNTTYDGISMYEDNVTDEISQFPKYSPIACLNISNNSLTSDKLQPSIKRPFAYLFNLTTLDASANNLTEFPLSLVHSNRRIAVDLSGNNKLPCKHFQKVMENNNMSLVEFLNYNATFCALDLRFNWFKEVTSVPIDHVRVQKELNVSCRNIQPANINCTCVLDRLDLARPGEVTNTVAVDCSMRHLKEMPTKLPYNTVKLNVSYNHITSLQVVGDDPSYEHLRHLAADHNDISSIVELEGTKFIDNFQMFSITHNKLKAIHIYVLSNKFDSTSAYTMFSVAGNYIHCDCNTEKVLKPWLLENFKNIPDFKSLQCDYKMGAVVDLVEFKVCHTPRDWTDYIYYIIGLEVLILVLLVSKVSYDYWVFKTAGYLPWPANKMPRLPCDWLCE